MANLTLNEYQDKAMSTCLPESDFRLGINSRYDK